MSVFKCKMCGGNLEVQEGMTVCECEYCGSIQTVPQLDDEKKINLFTRANRLRSACEFDKASGVYESIVSEFPEEAEAYWGLVLCQYGIEYVDDPKTGKKIPTCHRSSFDSIMDDPNFEMVLEYSDPTSRAVYRDEAKAIERLRTAIIEVSSKEDPYDIFICYKETDPMGERTIDSVIAQDVYDALTEKGYKVFFSRITLEDKLGQEYEPYIFAALNSAKVMLAFGSDYEYFNAVWVKNEWSRFLSLIEKGAKKTLIPCFKGIDAYDMPKEFARLQAQDMGKVGAIQDLLRGIGKILGTNNKPAGNSFSGAVSAEGTALVQRGNMALEDGDFEGAESYFERSLDADPYDARAYLGKFLAIVHVPSLADFEDKVCWLEDAKEFKRAEQFADPALAKELRVFREANDLKIERLCFMDAIKKIAEKKAVSESMQLLAQCTEESYKQALALFDAIAESKCIKPGKARDYKKDVECQYAVLKYLRENLDIYSYTDIQTAVRGFMGFGLRTGSLDQLLAAGLIEKYAEGYCWPGAKEEKERLLREAEEEKKKAEEEKKKCDELYKEYKAAVRNEKTGAVKKAEAHKEIDSLKIIYNNLKNLKDSWQGIEDELFSLNRKLNSIKSEIDSLTNEKSSLGFFAAKRKKEITERMVVLGSDQKSLMDNITSLEKKTQGCNTLSELESKISRTLQQIEEQNKIIEKLSSDRSSQSIRDELCTFELGKKLIQRFDYFQNIKEQQYIIFGAYEQDNKTSNGKEDIEWLVLEVKDGKALVISKYALDHKPYNTSETDVTWETCTLRKWLNNDFINAAFSAEEKAMIPTVTVSADKNPKYDTNPGNATQDQVFLLSITDVNKYFSSGGARQCKPTNFAVANGAYKCDNGNCSWLLRSPGHNQDIAAEVTDDGYVFVFGSSCGNALCGVRPALWIDLYS